MKRVTATASPFARKVRVLIMKLGLQEAVTLQDPGVVTPVSNNATLNAINPLGMLPALELDNGECLYDSPVICELSPPLTTNNKHRGLLIQVPPSLPIGIKVTGVNTPFTPRQLSPFRALPRVVF